MNKFNSIKIKHLKPLAAALLLCIASSVSAAGSLEKAVDDFSDAQRNNIGIDRLFIDDTTAGGQTTPTYEITDGILSAKGEISPPRGQPGWASAILLLDPQGAPMDASQYEGIRLLVRVNKGILSISANSSEITNYDYHASTIARHADGAFHEIKIPFSSMKRAWSAQTKLNPSTLASISLVAFGMQKGTFDYEVDEISFY